MQDEGLIKIALLTEGQTIAEDSVFLGKAAEYYAYCDSAHCELYVMNAKKVKDRFDADRRAKKVFQFITDQSQKIHGQRAKQVQTLYDSNSEVGKQQMNSLLNLTNSKKDTKEGIVETSLHVRPLVQYPNM